MVSYSVVVYGVYFVHILESLHISRHSPWHLNLLTLIVSDLKLNSSTAAANVTSKQCHSGTGPVPVHVDGCSSVVDMYGVFCVESSS